MNYYRLLICSLFALALFSCHDEEDSAPEMPTSQTLIMFMPWSTNMTTYFEQNITDVETAIGSGILHDERFIVCMSPTPDKAYVIELLAAQGRCVRDTLFQYEAPRFTRQEDITQLLTDIRRTAPALTYALIVGGHGMGWLPTGRHAPRLKSESLPQTRWFGGLTTDYQIATTTLASAIAAADMHMEYILFDDCYMSSVEVAYDLKDVTNYLIGCPTEIMIYGFPYHQCAAHLVGTADYDGLCRTFLDFYSTYFPPCATIAVTDCREVEALAATVRQINMRQAESGSDLDDVQPMDGYHPTLFYDLGDYINHVCDDPTLLEAFNSQLARTVPYKAHTDTYYSAADGSRHPIETYSGITTSEPSATGTSYGLEQTQWFQATH